MYRLTISEICILISCIKLVFLFIIKFSSSLFWDVTQRKLLFGCDVPIWPIHPILKDQAVNREFFLDCCSLLSLPMFLTLLCSQTLPYCLKVSWELRGMQ